ncbi:MAG: Tol-Pal system beta propeller repeat protein TolB [Magnetococcales bacterium]|nr:Tol-Pal system beta propeller repeat protein TolB [Magnetococcales bacterium]
MNGMSRTILSALGRYLTTLALLVGLSGSAHAMLRIDIAKGGLEPLPIALPYFVEMDGSGNPQEPGPTGKQITDVLTNDLERSGLFRPLNRQSYLQDPVAMWKLGVNHRDWRLIGAEALVAGAVHRSGNKLSVDFQLHDVYQGRTIGPGKRFSVPLESWRTLAHRVADEIYTRLTGEGGYFSSRITFVAQEGRRKWLSVMDQDGANRLDLTRNESQDLVLTPRFSPNGESLFYISYEGGLPRIFRYDLYSARKSMQTEYPGLNSTPSWSPDGTRMALTLSKDGNPEIYVKDLKGARLTRLTSNAGIDTSPSWSPDGRNIVFNSDRAGSPQLYIMDPNGGDVRRITFQGRYNAAPSWSPRGDLIAFVRGGEGGFRIAVIDPRGERERVLTNSWMDESPVWSPNGRVILFSRQRGDDTRLYTIDLTGHNEREVPLESRLSGSDPSWSALIQ